jgi:hypothetical protein
MSMGICERIVFMNNDTVEHLITRKCELHNLINGNRDGAGDYQLELDDIQVRLELEIRKRERDSLIHQLIGSAPNSV